MYLGKYHVQFPGETDLNLNMFHYVLYNFFELSDAYNFIELFINELSKMS